LTRKVKWKKYFKTELSQKYDFYLEGSVAETTVRSFHKIDKNQLAFYNNWENMVANPSTFKNQFYESNKVANSNSISNTVPTFYGSVAPPQLDSTRIKVSEYLDPDLKHIISLIQVENIHTKQYVFVSFNRKHRLMVA
jgi:hypothetical protein